MQEITQVRSLLLLLESPGAIAGLCLVAIFWLFRLSNKNTKLEFEKSIREATDPLKEEIHELKLQIIQNKKK